MRQVNKSDWPFLRSQLLPIILSCTIVFMTSGAVHSDTQQSEVRKTETKKSEPQDDSKPATDLKDTSSLSPQEKKQWAISLLEETLAGAGQIKPVEYSILTKVEAALMLLEFDRPRSVSILKDAVKAIRALLEERGENTKIEFPKKSSERRLWSSVIRKIAAVIPDLVGELLLENSSGTPDEKILGDWTEEARAMIGVASSHIEKNPALAIRIAEQTLPLGRVDLSSFLSMLSRHDSALAEQFAITLIDRFRDSSTRGVLWDLIRFVWVPERSMRLKEYFSQAMLVKLRRNIRPDTPTLQLDSDLSDAQSMSRRTAASFPHLQPEFDTLAYELAALLNARSDRPLASSGRIVISMGDKTEPGDTQEISDLISRVEAIKDIQTRDKEYQKLAVKAALKENLWLAEDLISKIATEKIRWETTFKTYDPFIRKALSESNWSLSEKYALKVEEPLGRTLAFDRMAQAMARSDKDKLDKDKLSIKRIYNVALTRLERDSPTEAVVKAFLIVARSLYPLDPMDGSRAINSAVSVMNKLAKSGELSEESSLMSGLSRWVRLPNVFYTAEEAIDTIDMFGTVLKEIAKRDAKEALIIAMGLTHPGLESLAHLAISKGLLEETKKAPARARQPKKPIKR